MVKKLFFVLCFFSCALIAQIPSISGIVLIDSSEKPLTLQELEKISGIKTIGLSLPGPFDELEEQLEPFLISSFDKEQILAIKKKVIEFYLDYYHPLIAVEVPTQDITSHVLQLIVTESKLGQIKIEGNQKWSHFNKVENLFALNPGDPICDREVSANINFLNRNPFREAMAIYEPGEKKGTTNLIIPIQDKTPFRVYLGTDNTGLTDTGEQLYYIGGTWGNFFASEHLLSYQYTTSDFHALQAHTLQYLAPLPNRHVLNLYGGVAFVNPQSSTSTMSNSGYGAQTSIRYTIPFLPTHSLRHEITAGFDFKRTNTNLLFSPDTGLSPFNQTVNLTQFMTGYFASYQQPSYTLGFTGELLFSPFEWLPLQSDTDFSNLRPGAKNRWIYFHGQLNYFQKLPADFSLSLNTQWQISSTTLLPSEEFGLGGYNTVRGYHTRVLNQENAILLSAEIYTPSWSVIHYFRKNSDLYDRLQFLAFMDYSYGSNITPVPGDTKNQYLWGVGPGMRYIIDPYLTCWLDWGLKLHKSDAIGTGFSLIHFGVIASY
jgi:hemolysin activation/secretion protein